MKVQATKLANGNLQLTIQDGSNGYVVMKLPDASQMKELGNKIMEESERMSRMERHFNFEEQRLKFT